MAFNETRKWFREISTHKHGISCVLSSGAVLFFYWAAIGALKVHLHLTVIELKILRNLPIGLGAISTGAAFLEKKSLFTSFKNDWLALSTKTHIKIFLSFSVLAVAMKLFTVCKMLTVKAYLRIKELIYNYIYKVWKIKNLSTQ